MNKVVVFLGFCMVVLLFAKVTLAESSSIDVSTGGLLGRTILLSRGQGVSIGPFYGKRTKESVAVIQRTIPSRNAFSAIHRIRFDSVGSKEKEWKIRLIHNGKTLASFSVEDLTEENGEMFYWTPEIPANGVSIVVDGNPFGLKAVLDRTQPFEVRTIPRVIVCAEGEKKPDQNCESWVNQNCDSRVSIGTQQGSSIFKWGVAVVAIRISRESDQENRNGRFGCTGFRVTENLVATAAHCWANDKAGEHIRVATADFFSEKRGSDRDSFGVCQGSTSKCKRVKLKLKADYLNITTRDFALLQFAEPPPSTPHLTLNVTKDMPEPGVDLRLIEDGVNRETGLPEKRVTDRGCRRLEQPPTFYPENYSEFPHTCDVEKTASGAPLFDSDGHVVGMHLGGRIEGCNAVNSAGRLDKVYSTMLKSLEDPRLAEEEKINIRNIIKELKIIKGEKSNEASRSQI